MSSTAILAQVANDDITVSTATDYLNEHALPSVTHDVNLFNKVSVPLLSVNKICACNLGVLFYGTDATVFKPTNDTINIDGTPVLKGSLDKQTELYMVNVHGNDHATLPGGNTPTPKTNNNHKANSVSITKNNNDRTIHRANNVTV